MKPTYARRAFSMLEVMLVIALITMLAGVVVFAMRGQADAGRMSTTKMKMRQLHTLLQGYYAQNSIYPDTLDVLAEGPTPMIDKVPKDGWKIDFFYDPEGLAEGENFTLISAGADKEFSTTDDINIWDVMEED